MSDDEEEIVKAIDRLQKAIDEADKRISQLEEEEQRKESGV